MENFGEILRRMAGFGHRRPAGHGPAPGHGAGPGHGNGHGHAAEKIRLDQGLSALQNRQVVADVLTQRQEADKQRAYRRRRSAQERMDTIEAQQQIQVERIRRDQLQKALDAATITSTNDPRYKDISEQSRMVAYLVPELVRDADKLRKLEALMRARPEVADVLFKLLTSDRRIHGISIDLELVGQELLQQAHQALGAYGEAEVAIQPIREAIDTRVKKLLKDEYTILRQRLRGDELKSRFAARLKLQGPQRQQFEDAVDRNDTTEIAGIIDAYTSLPDPQDVPREPWMETAEERVKDYVSGLPKENKPSAAAVMALKTTWDEFKEEYRRNPSLDTFRDAQEKLWKIESSFFPKDIVAGTEGWAEEVNKVHKAKNGYLDALAEQYNERLKTQGPSVLEPGLLTTDQLLEEYIPGSGQGLIKLLERSPDAKRLLTGRGLESVRFRNKLFLKIHSQILTSRREDSRDNFGLYERADFSVFISTIKEGLKLRDQRIGKGIGKKWAEHYTNLSQAIRVSRDMDVAASQPGANIETLIKIISLYQNEYAVAAMSIPAVEQAHRCVEATLEGIKATHNNYIPPDLIEADPTTGGIFLDDEAENMLLKMAALGQVYDVERDEYGFQVTEADGHTLKLNTHAVRAEDMDDLELAMYMTLAKGFGHGTLRWLEIFANSKIPGSAHPEQGMPGFHSIPYEGVAMALNYINVMVDKFKMGYVNYWHMMNMLVPENEKFRVSDQSGVEMMIKYRDGTLAKERPHLKRMMDMTNPSRMSSALGPQGTAWRYYDSTIGWTDKSRENIGGPVRVMLSKKYAEDRVTEMMSTVNYKLDYLVRIALPHQHPGDRILQADKCLRLLKEENDRITRENSERARRGEKPLPHLSMYTPWFEAKWQEGGAGNYQKEMYEDERKSQGKTRKGEVKHTHEQHEFKTWVKNYKRAYVARTWVETAMRDPLAISHNVNVEVPNVGFENDPDPARRTRTTTIHDVIIEHILGIPPEDFRYGTVVEKDPHTGEITIKAFGAKYSAQTEEQRAYLREIFDLEADLLAVQEVALREGRDLQDSDFEEVIGRTHPDARVQEQMRTSARERIEQAKEYWRLCRVAMMGTDDPAAAERLYREFGLSYDKELMGNYNVKWDKVGDIERTVEGLHRQTTEIHTAFGTVRIPVVMGRDWVDKDWDWVPSTRGNAPRKWGTLNLGGRVWYRRGSDAGAQYQGGQKYSAYLGQLNQQPDKEGLAKTLAEMIDAYSGDDWIRGLRVARNLILGTVEMYKYNLKYFGSYAEKYIYQTKFGVDAWRANDRFEFLHAVGRTGRIPPTSHDFFMGEYPIEGEVPMDLHSLERMAKAGPWDLAKEILLAVGLIALLATFYKALTARSEEEDGGGGGGGGGGHH